VSGGLASAACPSCGAENPESGSTCLSCGRSTRPEIGLDLARPFRAYFSTLWSILTHPTSFFRSMPLSGGVGGPLAFALITHWLGAALSFLWAAAIGGAISTYTDGLFSIFGEVADIDHPGRAAALAQARDRVVHWMWGAGSIVLDPFLTLLSIAFTAFFVWIGARIFVDPKPEQGLKEVSYESALRVVCFGMTPSILAGLPLLGGVVASLIAIVVTVIGAREAYRTTTGTAILVALFPKILWVGVIMMGFMAMALFFIKLVSSAL
jgi:hypothetical protein